MAGSIDPRCETVRGTPWPGNSAGVFGTRVAENHLGQRLPAASTGRTYGCKRSDQTSKKSCGTGCVHIWVPGSAGTTRGENGVRRDDAWRKGERRVRLPRFVTLQNHFHCCRKTFILV